MEVEINPHLEAINATEPRDGLCRLCTHIISRIGEDSASSTLPKHDLQLAASLTQPDIQIIQKLAEFGCPLCSMVWKLFQDSVRSHYGPPPEDLDFASYVQWVARQTPRLSMGMGLKISLDHVVYGVDYTFRGSQRMSWIEEDDPSVPRLIGVPDDTPDDEISGDAPVEVSDGVMDMQIGLVSLKTLPSGVFLKSVSQPPSASTASEASWAHCTSWLDQCTGEHESCIRSNDVEYILPARLIDVGDESTPPHICTSDKLDPTSKYVTLSHCWGTQKKVTLNKDTLGPFQSCIPPEALSKTFNEAIMVTRRLRERYGVRYLWIDSLCILQDSLDDWRLVAGSMAEVYGNCWCNLAATSAPDGRSGLFTTREQNITQPLTVQGPKMESYLCVNADRWINNIDDAPLNQRAWVIQERLLSRRILHFAQDEIFFECQAGRASETFFQGEPVTNDFTTDGVKDVLLGSRNYDKTELPPLNEVWTTIIETVAGGNLSYPGDKLIAFAGVAKQFQHIYDCGDYLAGLWKAELERQLVWKTRYGTDDLNDNQATKSDIRRAPSWSWTALEADIDGSWAPPDSQSLITILDASVEPVSQDSFSELADWVLRIKCRLVSGHYDLHAPRGEEITLDFAGEESLTRLFFYPDVKVETKVGTGEDKHSVYLVPIFRVEGDDECIQGLVLEPTAMAKGQFRRIGTFEDLIGVEIDIMKEGVSADIGEFEVSHGSGWYTISIV